MASGGFAGGLADGINNGMQLYLQKKRYDGLADRLEKADEREAEEHEWKRADRDKDNQFLTGLADIAESSNEMSFRNDGSRKPLEFAAPQQSVALLPPNQRPGFGLPGFAKGGLIDLERSGPSSTPKGNGVYGLSSLPKGYARGGMISDEAFVQAGLGTPRQTQAVNQGMSLGDLDRLEKSRQQQMPSETAASEENLTPAQRITKVMLSTDLLNNPDKLSKMQAYAEMHGKGDMIKPFLERAYTAKKRGLVDGAMQLMRGQVDEAIDSLKAGGINLGDRPVPVDDSLRRWKINIDGAGEREMDIGDLLQTTLDVDKFLKHDLDRNESQALVRSRDANARESDSRVRVSNAQIGKIGEEVKSIRAERETGSGERISKLPAPAATAEWLVKNGVYSNYKDAFGAVKTLNDKSPAAQRQELIKARMEGGMVSLSDAAKEVDEFIRKSGAGQETDGGSGKVFKWNPETGSIE